MASTTNIQVKEVHKIRGTFTQNNQLLIHICILHKPMEITGCRLFSAMLSHSHCSQTDRQAVNNSCARNNEKNNCSPSTIQPTCIKNLIRKEFTWHLSEYIEKIYVLCISALSKCKFMLQKEHTGTLVIKHYKRLKVLKQQLSCKSK